MSEDYENENQELNESIENNAERMNVNFDVLNDFEEIINNSKLNDFDWLLGKSLSGISSESGFSKVSRIIKNQEEFIRKE